MTKPRKSKHFLNDKSGQFSIMLALLALPLLAGVGMSVDYTYAIQAKSRLRDANDAAALFAAIDYRKKGVLPPVAAVLTYVSSNYSVTTSEIEPTITKYEIKDGKLYLDANLQKPLMFMQIFGQNATNVVANSVVNVGDDEELEIALALDTTHSMLAYSGSSSTDLDPSGGYFPSFIPNVNRLEALRYSATEFTNTIFEGDAGKGRTRISVVPFADYVNVGTDKRGASWLNVPPDTASTGTSCYDYTPITSTSNCRELTTIIDGATVPYTQCDHTYGPKEQVCYPTGGTGWWGCVGSRNAPLNLRDASPSSKFTGIMDVWCAMPIQALSDDKNQVLSTIANLSPYGNTYIPEGVMWGLRTLSNTVPYTEVKTAAGTKKVRKIMVLMTDGDNQAVADIPAAPTHHGIFVGEPGYASDRAQTDNWTLEACNQVKSEDIELYTISFGTDITAQARSIVQSCATDPDHYFDAKDAEALNKAFQAIAAKVNGMFLAG